MDLFEMFSDKAKIKNLGKVGSTVPFLFFLNTQNNHIIWEQLFYIYSHIPLTHKRYFRNTCIRRPCRVDFCLAVTLASASNTGHQTFWWAIQHMKPFFVTFVNDFTFSKFPFSSFIYIILFDSAVSKYVQECKL